MKSISRIAVLLFCLSMPAFGQDLTYYSKMGKVTPHVTGSSAEESLLIYRRQGVVFKVFRGHAVRSAMVFQPGLTPPAARNIGANELVPGVGACGMTLGMPREKVDILPFARVGKGDINGTAYRVGQETMVMVLFYAGAVSQLEVYGHFTTPEGITERSTDAQILAVYGRPDQQFDFAMRKGFMWTPIAFLIMPVLGLMTGFVLRKTRPRLLLMTAIGAAGLLVAVLISAFAFTGLIGLGKDWHSISYVLASAALTGAGSVLVLELLSRRVTGCLGSFVTLFAMLFVALIAVLLVGAVEPTGSLGSPWGTLALFNGPYVIALFLGAGTRRTQ